MAKWLVHTYTHIARDGVLEGGGMIVPPYTGRINILRMTLILNFGSKGAAALGECDAKGANHSFGAASVSTGIKQMNLHECTISLLNTFLSNNRQRRSDLLRRN